MGVEGEATEGGDLGPDRKNFLYQLGQPGRKNAPASGKSTQPVTGRVGPRIQVQGIVCSTTSL